MQDAYSPEYMHPEQLVIKINALFLIVFPAYKVDLLINKIGINMVN